MDGSIVMSFMFGVGLTWMVVLRIIVRRRDAIPGSPFHDLCTTIWTSLCCLSLCQLARHEKDTEKVSPV